MAKRSVRVVLVTQPIPEELRRPIVLHTDVSRYLKKLRRADPPKTEG